MAIPVYVLLPEGVDWNPVPGTDAQAPRPVRWYLRQSLPQASVQVGVLVSGEGGQLTERLEQVIRHAEMLGGIAIDAGTQEPLEQHLRDLVSTD